MCDFVGAFDCLPGRLYNILSIMRPKIVAGVALVLELHTKLYSHSQDSSALSKSMRDAKTSQHHLDEKNWISDMFAEHL